LNKKVFQSGLNFVFSIYFAFCESFSQVLGGQVDIDDLVGLGDHRIRNPFPHFDAHELFDSIIEAFQVLDVHGCDHMDAAGEDFLDILVTLDVPAFGHVVMGKLIDQRHGRLSGQHGIHIHFFHFHAFVFPDQPGDDFESFQEFADVGAAMGFHKSDHHIDTVTFKRMPFLEHAVGLADPGAIAEIDLQASLGGTLDHAQKFIRFFLVHVRSDYSIIFGWPKPGSTAAR
jgi:hypothetical protein